MYVCMHMDAYCEHRCFSISMCTCVGACILFYMTVYMLGMCVLSDTCASIYMYALVFMCGCAHWRYYMRTVCVFCVGYVHTYVHMCMYKSCCVWLSRMFGIEHK